MICRVRIFQRMILVITVMAVSASASLCLAQTLTLTANTTAEGQSPSLPQNMIIVDSYLTNDPVSAVWMKINPLKSEFAAAKSDEERSKVKVALRTAITEAFDISMKQRKEQIEVLSTRAAKIQEKLDRRLAAKGEMIALQMKAYLIDGPDEFSASGARPMVPVTSDELTSRIRAFQAANAKENSDEMKKAKDELVKALEQHFESDMEKWRKDLEAVQSQVATLAKQSEIRQAKKDEIISLRLQLAINEAQGLGLFADAPGRVYGIPVTPEWSVYHGQANVPPQPMKSGVFPAHSVIFGPPPAAGATFAVEAAGVAQNPGNLTVTNPFLYNLNVTLPVPENTASPSSNQITAGPRAINSSQWSITVEPNEPAVLFVDSRTRRIAGRFSLRKFGLPDYERIELDGENIVVHTRDGKVQTINTGDGFGWKQLTPEEVRERSLKETERAKAEKKSS